MDHSFNLPYSLEFILDFLEKSFVFDFQVFFLIPDIWYLIPAIWISGYLHTSGHLVSGYLDTWILAYLDTWIPDT